LEEFGIIKGKNVLNIDESRAHIRCLTREYIIMLIEVKEIYIASPKNRKLVTVIKTIYVDRRKPLPPFIIALGKKIINN
ncbi:hypothetical protein V8E51_001588, partial [Hyaloscypha variabilis]